MKLDGKVVIVTGAKGGLGNFVTSTFLQAGVIVIGVSRSIKNSDFQNERFFAESIDLTNEGAREVAGKAVAQFGRIDGLVHLVGGFAGGQTVAESEDSLLERMIDLNVGAALRVIRALVPVMRKQNSGRILAVGSKAALEPAPMAGVYAASKAALVSLIRTVARENMDRSITANVVLPGTMDTPANRAAMPNADFSKWVHPTQVAGLLLHLMCDEASDITGAAIPIYGGEA